MFSFSDNRRRNSIVGHQRLEDRCVLSGISFLAKPTSFEPVPDSLLLPAVQKIVGTLESEGASRTDSSLEGLQTAETSMALMAKQPETLLLPAVQKFRDASTNPVGADRPDGFTSYDFGLDTLMATDAIFEEFK